VNNEEGHKRLIAKLRELMKQQTACLVHGHDCHQGLFAQNLYLGQRIPLAGVAHQNGTIRFGRDPETSALDPTCKAHEVDNLYVVDGSFFPSSGAVNPALTIMANALRIGDHLLERMNDRNPYSRLHCGHRNSPAGYLRMKLQVQARRLLSGGSLLLIVLSLTGGTLWAVDGGPLVSEVAAIGITVSDLDRAVDFYSRVLSFGKVSEVEVWGDDYEHLEGIFGLRMHVAKMRLGNESIELTEYLTPKGRAIPVDSRSNDRWFQHAAIIVSDIDRAYQLLRQNHVQHASTGPQRLPDWNKNAAGISAFYFKDPDGHTLEVLQFPPDKGDPKWHV
jgi:catechol 2,3-dioxygenase-like lactoylglutathione lyase family enzyme